MSDFKIYICEDQSSRLGMIKAMIKSLQEKHNIIVEPVEVTFKEILEQNRLAIEKPNLLILDLYDASDDRWYGLDCLEMIKTSDIKIPTIIFSGDKDGDQKNHNFLKEYDFVIEDIDKNKEKITGLKDIVELEILKKLPPQYTLKNENDIILQYQLATIGELNLNQIINQIKGKLELKDNLVLGRMISGYSGAVLTKFKYQNTEYILKLSNEITKLEIEFINSQKFYPKFPSKFFNYISHEKYYSRNNKTLGILIKLVEDGVTLFDFINKASDFTKEIEPLLIDIFTNNYSLKKHYLGQREGTQSWTYIFNKFSNNKFSIVENSYEELEIFLLDFKINYSNLKNLVINYTWGNLDKNKLAKISPLVLCHGDLHSKNILIQGNHSFLIDTGGIAYDFWCFDLCRLIIDLFIKGIDFNTIDFYDINKIPHNVNLAKFIIELKEIPLDGKNDNVIKTINWLLANCSNIYADLYCKFEFQLGLMKEFLQASCRAGTLSHNKRAIALISAYECMLKANESVKEIVS